MIREPKNASPELQEFFRVLQQGAPILNGSEVAFATLATTGVQVVRHGLGRVYRGALVQLADQPIAAYFLDPKEQNDPATYLYYRQGAAIVATGKFWVW